MRKSCFGFPTYRRAVWNFIFSLPCPVDHHKYKNVFIFGMLYFLWFIVNIKFIVSLFLYIITILYLNFCHFTEFTKNLFILT